VARRQSSREKGVTRRRAKALRANLTEAERRLWHLLRAHRFKGVKFKRQALIGRYIVDFVSFERRLVIEVVASMPTAKLTSEVIGGSKIKDFVS
jgi:very-short-patch-repair endonuclease